MSPSPTRISGALAQYWVADTARGFRLYREFLGAYFEPDALTAAEAGPAWTKWSVKIPGLSPGKYLFMAAEYSAKDGSLIAQDTHNATLE